MMYGTYNILFIYLLFICSFLHTDYNLQYIQIRLLYYNTSYIIRFQKARILLVFSNIPTISRRVTANGLKDEFKWGNESNSSHIANSLIFNIVIMLQKYSYKI